MQESAATPSTLLPPSTAQSDAVHEDKRQRTHSGQHHHQQEQPEQQEQQEQQEPQQGQQQRQQSPLAVEAH